VHIVLSPAMFISFFSLGAPIVFVVVLMLRGRSGSGRGGSGGDGGRHASGSQPDSRFSGAADPRFGAEPDPRFAPVPDPRFASMPDPGFGSAPDPRLGGADDSGFAPNPQFRVASPPLPSIAAASTSVLASGGDASATGDPFPTTGRALAVIGGHALTEFGVLILLLAATPTRHQEAHIGNNSAAFLGILMAVVGGGFALNATARVQRDVMGGGWNSRISLRYISPQIALYVMSPSGISAAAERLNIAPVLAMLVVYGLLATDVLLIFAHYFGRW
jgi:hypothetical protein